MKNYGKLLEKVSSWLKPGGKLFIHIFTHRDMPYHFEDGWLAENFFVWPVLTETYGAGNELKWWVNWRLFFMATAELFGMNDGQTWVVSHYRFVKH
eukprot:scaffold895_cov315-Pinguiococcus_pyrenoidosus.AAC.60